MDVSCLCILHGGSLRNACVCIMLVYSGRQDVNYYDTTGSTTPVRVDCRNGQPPVANEPQYAPIDSTIRERTVSQHYEFENDPVLNPMYRVRHYYTFLCQYLWYDMCSCILCVIVPCGALPL